VSSTSLDPDEIRAAAEVHRELGPDYQSAVIESFLDKVGKEIDARVDARMAEVQQFRRVRGQSPMTLPIVSLVFGIPLTAISAALTGLTGLVVIWAAIAVINVAFALHVRPPGRR